MKNRALLRLLLALHEQVGFTACYAVDGSHEPARKEAGVVSAAATAWGVWDGKAAAGGALHADVGIYRAELHAVRQALEREVEARGTDGVARRVLILSDCQPSLRAVERALGELRMHGLEQLRGRSGGLAIEEVVRLVLAVEAGGGEVHFVYTPAHGGGISANAYADAIAKSHLSEAAAELKVRPRSRLCVYTVGGRLVDEPLFGTVRRLLEAREAERARDQGAPGRLVIGGARSGLWAYPLRRMSSGGRAGTAQRPSTAGRALQLRAGLYGLPGEPGVVATEGCPLCDSQEPVDFLHVATCECSFFSPLCRAEQRSALGVRLGAAEALVPRAPRRPQHDTLGAWQAARRRRVRVAATPAPEHAVAEPGLTEEDDPTLLPAFSFDRAVAGQCASDVRQGIEPTSSENYVLVPWLVRALQQAAGMEEEGAEVGARLRAMAAAAGRVTVHDGDGQVSAATVEGCTIRAVRVVYGQLSRRHDRMQAAAAEVPEWMAAEVAEARAAGETGWVERTRRGFDEMSGAAQRHEWEQLAVAPAGEGAYRVVGEAMRPLQLKFVVEVELPAAAAAGETTAVAASIQYRSSSGRRDAARRRGRRCGWRCAQASWSGSSGTIRRGTAGSRAGGRRASTATGRRRCGSACCTPATLTVWRARWTWACGRSSTRRSGAARMAGRRSGVPSGGRARRWGCLRRGQERWRGRRRPT